MKIVLRRRKNEIIIKCEGEFVEYRGIGYSAGNGYIPIPYKNGIIWFGTKPDNPNTACYQSLEEAKEAFEKTKKAALDYQQWLRSRREKDDRI